MNRDEVLAHHAHDEDAAEDAPLGGAGHARRVRVISVAQLLDDPVRQQSRQSRVGHRHGECAEEGVGQGDLCAAGEAVLEGDHRAGHAHAGDQAAHERGNEEGDDDVHARDAEDQHDEHGEHDCVEDQHVCSCVEGGCAGAHNNGEVSRCAAGGVSRDGSRRGWMRRRHLPVRSTNHLPRRPAILRL